MDNKERMNVAAIIAQAMHKDLPLKDRELANALIAVGIDTLAIFERTATALEGINDKLGMINDKLESIEMSVRRH